MSRKNKLFLQLAAQLIEELNKQEMIFFYRRPHLLKQIEHNLIPDDINEYEEQIKFNIKVLTKKIQEFDLADDELPNIIAEAKRIFED